MSRYACPECHSPINAPRRGKDGRCLECRQRLYRWAVERGSKWARRLKRSSAA